MNHVAISALSGLSDGGTSIGIFTFLFVLLAFAPIGVLLSGGWSVIGGLIWLSLDGLVVWRLWSSVTSWGNRRRWFRWWTWMAAFSLGLSAYLGLNLIVALAADSLRGEILTSP